MSLKPLMKEDIYTLFIFANGTRLYFKNDNLHREHGPAIKSALSSLVKLINEPEDIDSHLYTEVYPKKSNAAYFRHKLSDGSKIKVKSPMRYIYANQYHINGKQYSEQEFKEYHVLKFQEDLQNELSTNNINHKKIKL